MALSKWARRQATSPHRASIGAQGAALMPGRKAGRAPRLGNIRKMSTTEAVAKTDYKRLHEPTRLCINNGADSCCIHDLPLHDPNFPGGICCWCGDLWMPKNDETRHGKFIPNYKRR